MNYISFKLNRKQDGNVSSRRPTKGSKRAKVFHIYSGRFIMKNSQKKCRNTQRVPFVLGKRFKSSDIACWATRERLFLNLCLLLSKTQYNYVKCSDIALYSRYYVKISNSIEKKLLIHIEKT